LTFKTFPFIFPSAFFHFPHPVSFHLSLRNKREIKLFSLSRLRKDGKKFQLPIEERIMEAEDEMHEKEVV